MKKLALVISLIQPLLVVSQFYSGSVMTEERAPAPYVNIGVPNNNVGTVSDINGKFTIYLTNQKNSDSLVFSSIGFFSFSISIADFKAREKKIITLERKSYPLKEAIIKSAKPTLKRKGVTTDSELIIGKLVDSLGYELGVKIRNNKHSRLKNLYVNIGRSDYDSLFFRVNIYNVEHDRRFKNILTEPLYLTASKKETDTTIIFDLYPFEIWVKSDFLVTLEYVKNLGQGGLFYCAAAGKSCYFRTTSQGDWKKVPFAPSISVDMLFYD